MTLARARKTGRLKRHGPDVGEVRFDGLILLSSPGRVMTPRATSEQLVAAASAHVGAGVARVVDVGTGSGAIAIAVASACPHAEVWATDNSRSAVLLARANARRHGLAGRVFVRHGDLLAPVPGRFDVIVANLPYLAASTATDYPELKAEPFEAVFSSGDGLALDRRLVDAAPTRLAEDGVLLLQLERRLVVAGHDELPALRAALAAPPPNALPGAALVERIAGLAA
jgi:release factor glutamine methyltransferase